MLPVILLLAASAALAQEPDAPTLAFDVASVKPGQPIPPGIDRIQPIRVSPGTVTMRNVNLKTCIRWAYHVTEYQVTGPDWLDSQRFEIAGKAAGPASEVDLRRMMQALLKERFKLEFHRQTKDLAAYVLTVGKNGPKAQESKSEGEMAMDINRGQFSVTVQRAPMSQLVDMLGNAFRAPIVDMTGLKGRYDLTLNIAKYAADLEGHNAGPQDPLNLIAMVLQEELGLKLEPKKMPLDLLVVDHAEKAPLEN